MQRGGRRCDITGQFGEVGFGLEFLQDIYQACAIDKS